MEKDVLAKLQGSLPVDYILTIYSSKPCEIQKLDDSRHAVMTGQWSPENCGGCHLFQFDVDKSKEQANSATWKDNPKFNLKLHCTQKTEVKITLSRPEKAWKKQIAKSSVDCMMGLYIWPLVENQ
jgi:hypothetical protein